MRTEVQFHYDREADVLYLSVGRPQRAKSVEMGEDFILRLHPKTAEVVGVTIINFSREENFRLPIFDFGLGTPYFPRPAGEG